ncbi:MAG: glycosyltransferase family 39 protein [Candidatus Zixiibacteriota bacterium]
MKNRLDISAGLIAVIIIATILRLIYLEAYHDLPLWDQLTVDNYYHHNWALSIANGNLLGDTTYFRAPFYVFCLAALYSVLGASLWVARIFGLVIGLTSILMTYKIGRRVFGHKVGLLAATIHALYPVTLYFEFELLLDPLFTLLFQIAIYRALIWWESQRTLDMFYCGLWLGLAAITRPTAMILVPIVFIVIASIRKWTLPTIKHCVAFVLGIILIVLPITVRNIVVADDPVLIASQGGINFYIGNNEAADGISAAMPEPLGFNWRIQQITFIAERDLGKKLSPGEVSTYWFNKALQWIQQNPASFISLYLEKLYRHVSNREISNNRNLDHFFDQVLILKSNPLSFGILFALSVVGVFLVWGRNNRALLLYTIIICYMLVSALFFFNSRFRLPLLPIFFVLSSYSLYWLSQRLTKHPKQVLLPLAAAVLFGLFSFHMIVKLPEGAPSQYLTSQGLYYLNNGEYRKALQTFQIARAIDPTFPETNLNIGAAFVRLGKLDSALYYFDREHEFNPLRPKTYTNIASVHLLRNQPRMALQEVEKTLQAMPYDITANLVFLRAIFADSQLTIENFTDSALAAIDRTNGHILVLNDAGAMLTSGGDLRTAATILQAALESPPPPIETDDGAFERNSPNSPANREKTKAVTCYQLGYISGMQGAFTDAVRFSKMAIERDSTMSEAYVNLISGYLSTGRVDDARRVLNIALTKFPGNDYLRRFENLQTFGN